MGKITRVTADGQVTIPQDVRDALGWTTDETVEIEMLGKDAAVIRRPRDNRDSEYQRIRAQIHAASERFAHLREHRPTDDIMREIRGDDPFPP